MNRKIFRSIFLLTLLAGLLSSCATAVRVETHPGVSVSGNAVYISQRTYVYKADLKTGIEAWRYPEKAGNASFYAPALLDEGRVFVGDYAHGFTSLVDGGAPTKQWSVVHSKGWYEAKAVLSDGVIIVPNTDRNIYALSAEDGHEIWHYAGNFAYITEVLVLDNKVIVSSQDHQVLCLDKATGELIWTASMKGAVIAQAVYDSKADLLMVGTLGKEFVALKPATGERAWTFTHSSLSSIWAPAIVMQDQVLFSDESGKILSLNIKDGSENWRIEAGGKMQAGLAAIGLDQFVFAREDGTISAYDLNQSPIWTRNVEAKLYATPVVSGEMIVLAANDAKVLAYAFDLKGNQIWAFTPAK